jgi:hypothetical protein
VGRTNRVLSFDTTWAAQKTEKIMGEGTHKQQGDLIGLITVTQITGGYTDRQTDRHRDSEAISLASFYFSK